MKSLKVLFVGVGSIAKRHIRNLTEICNESKIELHIDAFRRNRDSLDGIENVYCDVRSIPSDYDCVFITNPTSLHLETLKSFHDKGRHFFIEKPVVSLEQLQDAKGFIPKKESVYYVAAPLRYNAVIQYIKQNIDPASVISVRSISSSYLPDWRPGTDYRETYSAHKEQGGGVEIDLIHEWDYLTYLFGWPETIKSFVGKKSNLKIDSNDYAIYIAEYEDKIAELHLDYFGRETIREIELFTEDDTIIGDLARNTIEYKKSGKKLDFNEDRDSFQKRELRNFLDQIEGKTECTNDYWHALKVLSLTQGRIEEE